MSACEAFIKYAILIFLIAQRLILIIFNIRISSYKRIIYVYIHI